MRTEREDGPTIVLHGAADERGEASFVASEILRLRSSGVVRRFADVAILYRTNCQAHVLALGLSARGVPYRVAGAGDLTAHPDVRIALAYLRVAHDPEDGPAVARIADVPPRGLAVVGRHLRASPAGVRSLPALAARDAPDEHAAAVSLTRLIRRLRRRARVLQADALLDDILSSTGYAAWLSHQPDAESRVRRLDELRALAALAEDDLGEWLAHLAAGEAVEPPGADRVALTTIHGAKGKEWDVVFVLGLEEGLLPHRRALLGAPAPDDRSKPGSALLDELRLAYVAVTRPRDRLYLTYSRARSSGRSGGASVPREPSRFLRHVDASLIRRAA
jgi:DNA helicase-2/ATP-dependent DNA helicase PcrA